MRIEHEYVYKQALTLYMLNLKYNVVHMLRKTAIRLLASMFLSITYTWRSFFLNEV